MLVIKCKQFKSKLINLLKNMKINFKQAKNYYSNKKMNFNRFKSS